MLLMVYAPNGEPFEVQVALAKTLVVENGWSLEAPVAEVGLPLFEAVAPAPPTSEPPAI